MRLQSRRSIAALWMIAGATIALFTANEAVSAKDCCNTEKKERACCQPVPCCGQDEQKLGVAATCPFYEYMNWGSYSSYYGHFYPDNADCNVFWPTSIDGTNLDTTKDCPDPCIASKFN